MSEERESWMERELRVERRNELGTRKHEDVGIKGVEVWG